MMMITKQNADVTIINGEDKKMLFKHTPCKWFDIVTRILIGTINAHVFTIIL